jgi:hypothetical protein
VPYQPRQDISANLSGDGVAKLGVFQPTTTTKTCLIMAFRRSSGLGPLPFRTSDRCLQGMAASLAYSRCRGQRGGGARDVGEVGVGEEEEGERRCWEA